MKLSMDGRAIRKSIGWRKINRWKLYSRENEKGGGAEENGWECGYEKKKRSFNTENM